jgi:DNA mismatch endonuclease, patch repair protein
MSRIRGKDTKPELTVRRLIHSLGFRFRLHRRDLPGAPDIVLPRLRRVIFVHGCFWHRHAGCRFAYNPKTNREFWQTKFDANVARDVRSLRSLRARGWSAEVVWECELSDSASLSRRLIQFLDGRGHKRGRGAC